ncbi:DUF6292 family protein [Streptacidiphilus sp. EB103A]|uniref:DUF6292 family protein n=1 Tax=Streptacidiphilus sp. EB103A TaxID=3156275 RepID=UPI003512ECDE
MALGRQSAWNEEVVERLEERLGHYARAVARRLLDLEIPVVDVIAEPSDDDIDHAFEAVIEFSEPFQRLLVPAGACGLLWTSTSGWALFHVEDLDSDDLLPGARWLGAGIVPAPGKVASFLQAAQLGLQEHGSLERPYYRNDNTAEDLRDLEQRLSPYPEPCDDGTPWPDLFQQDLLDTYQGKAFTALLTDGPDPVLQIALRASEVTALKAYLQLACAQNSPVTAPGLHALTYDLHARIRHPGNGLEHRLARQAAAHHRPQP